jgi:cytidylate kinase
MIITIGGNLGAGKTTLANNLNPAHYDFVLDTTLLTEQQVFDKVMTAIKKIKAPPLF